LFGASHNREQYAEHEKTSHWISSHGEEGKGISAPLQAAQPTLEMMRSEENSRDLGRRADKRFSIARETRRK
jgi:hypothetical protein